MNRKAIKPFIFLSITLICILITGIHFTSDEKSLREPPAYILTEYNGKIAVFSGKKTSPHFIDEIEIKNLPEKDRQTLKNGIHVNSEEELYSLIEDFSS